MLFRDDTNKNGLINECEFWTNLGDGVISGNTTLLKQFTSRINRAYDAIIPDLLGVGDKMRWDDTNHTDRPVATFDIESGTNNYQFLTDDNSLAILNVTDVRILPSATSTEFMTLRRMTMDETAALEALSPNASSSGKPSAYLEVNNTIYFDVSPDYSKTGGGKLFFERIADYFTSSDTTQTPGIPAPYHQLLALYASLDWILVNKPEANNLITRIEAKIDERRKALKRAMDVRNPLRRRVMSGRPVAE